MKISSLNRGSGDRFALSRFNTRLKISFNFKLILIAKYVIENKETILLSSYQREQSARESIFHELRLNTSQNIFWNFPGKQHQPVDLGEETTLKV